jgi:serine/threonine protein phosphatase PrpC
MLTHVGLVRKENEDCVFGAPQGGLWAVADGMGGHARGAWAARTVCAALESTVLFGELNADCDRVADALAEANELIVEEGARGGETIGSTIVALLTSGSRLACLWSGDSRMYRLRDGTFQQLTRDHSQVNELVSAGLITEDEARSHPLGNVITRAIGVSPGLALDVIEDQILPQDVLLLCSDGLNKCLSDNEIATTIIGGDIEVNCKTLIAKCLERGAPDNVSVVLLHSGPAVTPHF